MNQSQYIRKLASCSHFTEGDLMNRANRLREAGMLAKGGRGLSAAKITAHEASLIILAAMSGASANTCPDAIKNLPTGLVAAVADILGNLTTADKIEKFSYDFINKFAVINFNDGCEDRVFGTRKDYNSGVSVFINGSVLRLLSLAIMDKESKRARMFWGMEIARIAVEQGEAAAREWMRDNPFEAE